MATSGFSVFMMCLLLIAVVGLVIVTVVYIIPNFRDIINTVVVFVNTGIAAIVNVGTFLE
jgi:hypothetical protein